MGGRKEGEVERDRERHKQRREVKVHGERTVIIKYLYFSGNHFKYSLWLFHWFFYMLSVLKASRETLKLEMISI